VIATFFDFDGVLVDSEPVHLAAFNDVLAQHRIVIEPSEYMARYLSLDDAGVFRAVLTHRGATPREDEVRALVAAKHPFFQARFEEGFLLFPGAAEIVARRAARGPVGIVSGALEREIVFALDKMGLRDQIAFIVSAERTPVSKPDPAPYLLAIEKLRSLEPAALVVAIEDSLGGVASAKGARLRCVAVTHSYSMRELTQAGADATVASLAELTDALLDSGA
jgi:beta-phosphoglucomutase